MLNEMRVQGARSDHESANLIRELKTSITRTKSSGESKSPCLRPLA
jgi:hypothetical protein